MNDLKERWLKKRPYLEELSRAEFMKRTERTLVGRVVLDIKKTLDNLGVSYDQWFYESELDGRGWCLGQDVQRTQTEGLY